MGKKPAEEKPMLTRFAEEKHSQLYDYEKSNIMETSCGLTKFFRPKWLQRFATPRSFMVVFGILGTVQGMSFVYFSVTLTHIEKRFKISSQTTGMMLSGNEVSQILLSLLLAYIGGQKNRPVWVAWGVTCSAISCFILFLPHYLYGSGEDALALTQEYLDTSKLNNKTGQENLALCSYNASSNFKCTGTSGSNFTSLPTLIIFMSQFVLGIGTTLYYSLGQTYIDDNTKKTHTPMVLAITFSLRLIGPVFGFLIGSLCLKLYIDPTLTPLITDKDPRWIGAWWLGWIFLGTAQFIIAVSLAMFPKQMPRDSGGNLGKNLNSTVNCDLGIHEKGGKITNENAIQTKFTEMTNVGNNQKNEDEKTKEAKKQTKSRELSVQDFWTSLKRLLRNKLLMVNSWSGIFYIIGASGSMTYMMKYLEIQFEQSTSSGSIITGPIAILTFCIGFLSSGIVISRYRPGTQKVLMWNVIVGVLGIFSQLIMMTLSCESQPLQGYDVTLKRVDFINNCNSDCGCDQLKYSPVCHREMNVSYFSPCHAGCMSSHKKEGDSMTYNNCKCIASTILWENKTAESSRESSLDIKREVHTGVCSPTCGYNYILYIIVSNIMGFISCTGKIGNLLVNYRAVAQEDKAFAQGLSLLMISLFAYIPGPILFGRIIDTTCLIWDESCGSRGNCWLYDKDDYRLKVNLLIVALTSIGVILDAWVCYLGKDLNLYDEEVEENQNKQQQP